MQQNIKSSRGSRLLAKLGEFTTVAGLAQIVQTLATANTPTAAICGLVIGVALVFAPELESGAQQ